MTKQDRAGAARALRALADDIEQAEDFTSISVEARFGSLTVLLSTGDLGA